MTAVNSFLIIARIQFLPAYVPSWGVGGGELVVLCRVLYYTSSMTTTIYDQWSYSAPEVIFFLSPQKELVGDDTIAVQKSI